jgi:DNA-nicking Smr family endonuclease
VKPPRGLSAEEAEAWARVAQTVRPLIKPRSRVRTAPDSPPPAIAPAAPPPLDLGKALAEAQAARAKRLAPRSTSASRPAPTASTGLDSHWDRRFRAGSIEPDFTLDLHGHNLDPAHTRLIDGVAQARAMGARVVLLITGKPRPTEAADRGSKRGAIRAKVLDWLAASSHGAAIASIRTAHIRHGGEGALYLVLKRAR